MNNCCISWLKRHIGPFDKNYCPQCGLKYDVDIRVATERYMMQKAMEKAEEKIRTSKRLCIGLLQTIYNDKPQGFQRLLLDPVIETVIKFNDKKTGEVLYQVCDEHLHNKILTENEFIKTYRILNDKEFALIRTALG